MRRMECLGFVKSSIYVRGDKLLTRALIVHKDFDIVQLLCLC